MYRVPDGEEGVFPLVGHGENVLDVHVLPVLRERASEEGSAPDGRSWKGEKSSTNHVANPLALGRRSGLSWISLDPLLLDEHVELLGPAR
jgi:hypothetical protein